MKENRRCPECDKHIYYGIFCSNECSDKSYERWVAAGCPPVGQMPKKETK